MLCQPVITALALMAVAVFLGNAPRTLGIATGILSGRIADSDAVFKTIDEFVIWGCSIGLLTLIAYGVNWARWLNLVLAAMNVGLDVWFVAGAVATRSYATATLPLIGATLELGALYLLFLSPGRLWFERRASATAA